MSDNRKYYYLKLKENFYNSETMVILESMQDGLLYSNLLLKMYLMSLKSGGILMLNDHLPHTPQTIATFTRHQVGTVERALKVFLEFGLVEILTDGAYYMADIQLLIGQSSTEGERKKKERMRLKRQKLLPSGGADICPPYSQGDICPPEIRDKRLDIRDKSMIKLVHHEMVINSKFLEVPRSYYQRHLNANRVKRIAAEFDERIANAPKISYRNGHYYVFDGQHTIAARKLRNNNCDLDILCKVYSGLTEQEEALLFAQQTGISAPLTAGAKLRAKIHGGDPEAIAFLSATQRAGFGLSFNQSHAKWKIACIATAFGEYRQHGERIYTDALRVLAEAWEGDIDSLRSEVLQGVVRFVALYDHEYDPIRLIKQLKRISPLTIYRSGQAMSGPNYQKYMHQILKVYNGSSRSKSLPIKQ